VKVFRESDSLGRLTRERTVIPEHNYDEAVGYRYDTYRRERTVIYPHQQWQVKTRYDLDGEIEEIIDDGQRLLTRISQGQAAPSRRHGRPRSTTTVRILDDFIQSYSKSCATRDPDALFRGTSLSTT